VCIFILASHLYMYVSLSDGCLGPQYALQFILAMRSMVLRMCWFFIYFPLVVCRYESSAGRRARYAGRRFSTRVKDLNLSMYLHVVETRDLCNRRWMNRDGSRAVFILDLRITMWVLPGRYPRNNEDLADSSARTLSRANLEILMSVIKAYAAVCRPAMRMNTSDEADGSFIL
jgi:hypothetical protein